MMTLCALPAQPAEETWGFVEELKRPALRSLQWERTTPRRDEADLRVGVTVDPQFPDPERCLDTAYADMRRLLRLGGIPGSGPFRIVTAATGTDLREAYRIEVSPGGCRVLAADTEGIRRGIFYVEDRMRRACGPFLPLGAVERRPVIRTRISRCFFGPINRPPKCRDELADEVDYYPEEYLNRLAHDGVNGLWLTVQLKDLIRSTVIPELGERSERRLAKLRRTVAKCARYGIRIYVFCIEPAAFSLPLSRRHPSADILSKYPELGGHRGGNFVYFCPSTKLAQAYLEDVVRTLFSEAPGLGGLIDITVGERATVCPNAGPANNCPRCAPRQPWDALADSLRAMERGMHSVAPDAELVSWPYSQIICWGRKNAVLGASHVPENVILMQNFETGGGQMQLGKWRQAGDYWLSYIGPSPTFRAYAKRTSRSGTRMFAKLQVGCSHEVASVPHVPVPGNLYRKYKRMHELGVSGAMQCWYFGSYPSLMTKAAGELSFAPFPDTEEAFLLQLARIGWGGHAPAVVKAWKLFSKSYGHYPLFAAFGYYGPMHCGPTWPLHPAPRDLPLTPNWLVGCAAENDCTPYPPSGDRIGECLMDSHTLDEAVELTGKMTDLFSRGMAILKRLEPHVRKRPARVREVGVAETLGILFRSGHNILRFYQLREKIAWGAGAERLDWLKAMQAIARDELSLGARLLELTREDPSLGFNSEAEGYKFFPAALEWRMRQVRAALTEEFPQIEARLHRGSSAFPGYTGEEREGAAYVCQSVAPGLPLIETPGAGDWAALARADCRMLSTRTAGRESASRESATCAPTSWCAADDGAALYLGVQCERPAQSGAPSGRGAAAASGVDGENVCFEIEPRRLWPHVRIVVTPAGEANLHKMSALAAIPLAAAGRADERRWSATVRIPLEMMGQDGKPRRPWRVNVIRTVPDPADATRRQLTSWVGRRPLQSRLIFGQHNPRDFGWLVFG